MIYILCNELYFSKNPCVYFRRFVLIDKMKCLSKSGSSNFCPELRKNAVLISQSYLSNFGLHMIIKEIRRVEQPHVNIHSIN